MCITDAVNAIIAERDARIAELEAEVARLSSRSTGIVDVEGTPIEVGDTVRVRGLFNFGITEVDFEEECVVEKSNELFCHAVNEREVCMGNEMYYNIDYFPLEDSSDEGNEYLVIKKWSV